MKCYVYLLMGVFILTIGGCTSNQNTNPEKWTDARVSEWFNQKDWLGQTSLKPDSSINKKEFAIQYYNNKERWDKAFSFLKNEDLSALEVGVHDLDGKNVFVKVTQYYSKDPSQLPFEVHQDYTDLHYVISGVEYIGEADSSMVSLKTPYDAKKDIAFYNADKSRNHLAEPGTFFIFFPNMPHRPGMRVNDSVLVKKIVIKVKNKSL